MPTIQTSIATTLTAQSPNRTISGLRRPKRPSHNILHTHHLCHTRKWGKHRYNGE